MLCKCLLGCRDKMLVFYQILDLFVFASGHPIYYTQMNTFNRRIEKMFPVTVRLFDVIFSCVMAKFLDMNVMERKDTSTAAAMF